MKVRDREIKQDVDVCEEDCLNRTCYWPRPDPGVFTQGQGYKTRGNKVSKSYLCGTRHIHGCPDKYCD